MILAGVLFNASRLYFTRLPVELFMVSISGYMDCVKLHHIGIKSTERGIEVT